MAFVEVDDSELVAYAVTLEKATHDVVKEIRPVMQRGALNVKRLLTADLAASEHFKGIAGAISYDTVVEPTGITAEIGPDKDRRGALANIAYFGSPSKPGGGTVPDPLYAAEAEYPNLERYLGDILEALL